MFLKLVKVREVSFEDAIHERRDIHHKYKIDYRRNVVEIYKFKFNGEINEKQTS